MNGAAPAERTDPCDSDRLRVDSANVDEIVESVSLSCIVFLRSLLGEEGGSPFSELRLSRSAPAALFGLLPVVESLVVLSGILENRVSVNSIVCSVSDLWIPGASFSLSESMDFEESCLRISVGSGESNESKSGGIVETSCADESGGLVGIGIFAGFSDIEDQ